MPLAEPEYCGKASPTSFGVILPCAITESSVWQPLTLSRWWVADAPVEQAGASARQGRHGKTAPIYECLLPQQYGVAAAVVLADVALVWDTLSWLISRNDLRNNMPWAALAAQDEAEETCGSRGS